MYMKKPIIDAAWGQVAFGMAIKKIITGHNTPRETVPKTAHMATSHEDYNRA